MRTIEKMFEHLNWANEKVLEALQNIEKDDRGVYRLFSHILFAEQIWFTRLNGLDSSQLPIWADHSSIEKCSVLISQNKQLVTSFFCNLVESELDNIISYKNSSGKTFTSSIRDILTHVALHGQYHRGQINLLLRQHHMEPIALDYIAFVR